MSAACLLLLAGRLCVCNVLASKSWGCTAVVQNARPFQWCVDASLVTFQPMLVLIERAGVLYDVSSEQ